MIAFYRRMVQFCLPLVLVACSVAASAAQATKPNIILILADDLGWADIGYNNPAVYSPNLDRLAEQGLKLTQHYVMPQCTPTRVALMTGRYPSRFGGAAMQASNEPAFPKGTPTLSAMLKQSGYRTYLAGKWHLGSSPDHGPNHFGFDHSYGSLAGAVGMYDHRYRDGKFGVTWHRDHELIDGHENGTHATDLVTQEAIRIIHLDQKKPFFIYLPYHSVHTPLDERGPFVDRPTQLDPKRPGRWLDEDEIPWFNDPEGRIQKEPDPEKRLLLAAVNHLDASVGQIVAALENARKLENTVILFSSDNGPQGSWKGKAYPDDLKLTDFNQPLPFKGKKLDVYEGGIRVSGFVHWPKILKPRIESTPMHIIDWFPTIAAMVGSPDAVPEQLDGINLWPLWSRQEPVAIRELYWTWSASINRWALRRGEWKVVKYGRGAPVKAEDWMLFNLKQDPAEKNDVARENPEILASMHQYFLNQRMRDAN